MVRHILGISGGKDSAALAIYLKNKYSQTRPILDGFRKNNVNYWAFREIRSIIPHS